MRNRRRRKEEKRSNVALTRDRLPEDYRQRERERASILRPHKKGARNRSPWVRTANIALSSGAQTHENTRRRTEQEEEEEDGAEEQGHSLPFMRKSMLRTASRFSCFRLPAIIRWNHSSSSSRSTSECSCVPRIPPADIISVAVVFLLDVSSSVNRLCVSMVRCFRVREGERERDGRISGRIETGEKGHVFGTKLPCRSDCWPKACHYRRRARGST